MPSSPSRPAIEPRCRRRAAGRSVRRRTTPRPPRRRRRRGVRWRTGPRRTPRRRLVAGTGRGSGADDHRLTSVDVDPHVVADGVHQARRDRGFLGAQLVGVDEPVAGGVLVAELGEEHRRRAEDPAIGHGDGDRVTGVVVGRGRSRADQDRCGAAEGHQHPRQPPRPVQTAHRSASRRRVAAPAAHHPQRPDRRRRAGPPRSCRGWSGWTPRSHPPDRSAGSGSRRSGGSGTRSELGGLGDVSGALVEVGGIARSSSGP